MCLNKWAGDTFLAPNGLFVERIRGGSILTGLGIDQRYACNKSSGRTYFLADALTCGRRFRAFNVVDDFNREALHIEVDTSINSQRLVRVFEQIKRDHGLPQVVRSDNGPEFLGDTFTSWLKANGVALQYIQPGKLNQNAFIERFNRTYREEVLDQHLFARLDDVREATHRWMMDYNEERSHDSLGGMTPVQYRNQHAESSTFEMPA